MKRQPLHPPPGLRSAPGKRGDPPVLPEDGVDEADPTDDGDPFEDADLDAPPEVPDGDSDWSDDEVDELEPLVIPEGLGDLEDRDWTTVEELPPVPEAVDHEGNDPWEDDEWEVADEVDAPAGLPILPWSTPGRLGDEAKEIPFILDPTRARSVWRTRSATALAEGLVSRQITVGPLQVVAELVVERGEPDEVRLGRDVLSGRALVRP